MSNAVAFWTVKILYHTLLFLSQNKRDPPCRLLLCHWTLVLWIVSWAENTAEDPLFPIKTLCSLTVYRSNATESFHKAVKELSDPETGCGDTAEETRKPRLNSVWKLKTPHTCMCVSASSCPIAESGSAWTPQRSGPDKHDHSRQRFTGECSHMLLLIFGSVGNVFKMDRMLYSSFVFR